MATAYAAFAGLFFGLAWWKSDREEWAWVCFDTMFAAINVLWCVQAMAT